MILMDWIVYPSLPYSKLKRESNLSPYIRRSTEPLPHFQADDSLVVSMS